jgi:hypothetical protein
VRIALLGVSVVALLLLAMSLSRLTMDPGVPFAQIWQFLIDQFRREGIVGPTLGSQPASEGLIRVMRTLFLVVLLMFPIAIIMTMIDRELRKRVLGALLRMIIIFALLGLFIERQSELTRELEGAIPGNALEGEMDDATSFTDEQFSASRVPPWIVWSLSLLVGLVIAAIVVAAINRVRRSRGGSGEPWIELANQAQAAIEEIRLGNDLRGSILRCYIEMIRIVGDSRGIRRASTMTAREFEEALIRAKLPADPVDRLTRLFERARYGVGDSTSQEESDAIASLQAIADACRSLA